MGILEGKRGLIMGVANEKSAAWGLRRRPRHKGLNWRSPIRWRGSENVLSRWPRLWVQTF